MMATDAGRMLQDAYEAMDVFEGAVRNGAGGGDPDGGLRDAARTAMGHRLDALAHALGDARKRVAALEEAMGNHVKRNHDQSDELVVALLGMDEEGASE